MDNAIAKSNLNKLRVIRQDKLIDNSPPELSVHDTGRADAPECPTPTADRPAKYPDSQCCFHVCRAVLDKT